MRVPKWQFVFLQRNTKFYNCTQKTIHFLQRNAKFWNCTQMAIRFFTTKYRILKVVRKRPFVFPIRKHEILLFIINLVLFLKIGKKKIKNMIPRYFASIFLQWKTELETLLNSEIHIIYKKAYNIIDYRKLVTSLYHSFLKPIVFCRKKTAIKK